MTYPTPTEIDEKLEKLKQFSNLAPVAGSCCPTDLPSEVVCKIQNDDSFRRWPDECKFMLIVC